MSCCCERKTHRDTEETRALQNRLSRIEGQVRGIKRQVDEDAYCIDILTQVSAAQAALTAFSRQLLARHIRTCVADGVRSGDDGKLDELVETLQKMIK